MIDNNFLQLNETKPNEANYHIVESPVDVNKWIKIIFFGSHGF